MDSTFENILISAKLSNYCPEFIVNVFYYKISSASYESALLWTEYIKLANVPMFPSKVQKSIVRIPFM